MFIAIPGIAIFGTYFVLSIKRFRSLIIKYEGEIITCENDDTKEVEIINRKDVLDINYVGEILYIIVNTTKKNEENSCRIIPVSFVFTSRDPKKVSRKLREFIR